MNAEEGNSSTVQEMFFYFNGSSNSSADAQNFQLYALLKDARQTPVLIIPALLLSLLGLVGIPLNGAILYISFKYRKTLNRNANFLLALNALFDMLQLCHPLPFLAVALSGTNFIGTFRSLCLLLPSLFGIQCSLTCIACTGIDRLLSVLLPIPYHNMSKRQARFYCAALLLLCVANGLWNAVGLWQKCAAEADKPVTGFIGQIGWDSSKDFLHFLVGPVLIWTAIFCYLAIGLLLRFMKKGGSGESGVGQPQQKLLKSLALIVGVHTATLLFGAVLLGFSSILSALLTWWMQCLSLFTILLGASSNAVVLYMNSSDYRALFKLALGDLKRTALRTIGITQVARIFTLVTPPVVPNASAVKIVPKIILQNRTVPI